MVTFFILESFDSSFIYLVEQDKKMAKIFYKMAKSLVAVIFWTLYRPEIEGKENIPKKGSLIFAGNHTNNLDCLLLISVTSRQIHFLAKHTLFKGPSKILMSAMGAIPVDRTKPKNEEAIAKSKHILESKEAICIFPEGTINRTEAVILPFKMGAVYLSSKTNSPLIPFIITGEYKVFKKSIRIRFLKPITCTRDLKIENASLMKKIEKELKKEKDRNV